jgi:hypothetical protein
MHATVLPYSLLPIVPYLRLSLQRILRRLQVHPAGNESVTMVKVP